LRQRLACAIQAASTPKGASREAEKSQRQKPKNPAPCPKRKKNNKKAPFQVLNGKKTLPSNERMFTTMAELTAIKKTKRPPVYFLEI
jgi:hypothetical protein